MIALTAKSKDQLVVHPPLFERLSEDNFIKAVATALGAAMQYSADTNAVYWTPQNIEGESTAVLPVTLKYNLRIKGYEKLGVYGVAIDVNVNFLNCFFSNELDAFVWGDSSEGRVWSGVRTANMVLHDLAGKPIECHDDSNPHTITLNTFTDNTFIDKITAKAYLMMAWPDMVLFLQSVLHRYNAFSQQERHRNQMLAQILREQQ